MGVAEAIDEGVERMLHAVAGELVAAGRLACFAVAAGEEAVAVQVIVAAGGEASYCGWAVGRTPGAGASPR